MCIAQPGNVCYILHTLRIGGQKPARPPNTHRVQSFIDSDPLIDMQQDVSDSAFV
jgi:hypothetical protein